MQCARGLDRDIATVLDDTEGTRMNQRRDPPFGASKDQRTVKHARLFKPECLYRETRGSIEENGPKDR